MSSITLLTSAGPVRVEGENLVIDIRDITEYPDLPSHAGEDGHPHPSSEADQVKDVQGVRVPSIPVHSEQETASALQDRNEPVSDSGASVTISHSAPSKAETGRAGGPVCAPVTQCRGMNGPAKAGGAADEQSTSRGPVTHSDPAERPSDAIFGERFSHPTSNVTTISSQPAGSVGVPHSKPHKSGKLEVQPANLSDDMFSCVCGDHCFRPMKHGFVHIFDAGDAEVAGEWKWGVNDRTGGSVVRFRSKRGKLFFHRVILEAPDGLIVDHINGNGCDNRRSNLRLCSNKENARNRKKPRSGASQYKGVVRQRGGNWGYVIHYDGRQVGKYGYATAEDAAIAYNHRAIEVFGKFARLNAVWPNGRPATRSAIDHPDLLFAGEPAA